MSSFLRKRGVMDFLPHRKDMKYCVPEGKRIEDYWREIVISSFDKIDISNEKTKIILEKIKYAFINWTDSWSLNDYVKFKECFVGISSFELMLLEESITICMRAIDDGFDVLLVLNQLAKNTCVQWYPYSRSKKDFESGRYISVEYPVYFMDCFKVCYDLYKQMYAFVIKSKYGVSNYIPDIDKYSDLDEFICSVSSSDISDLIDDFKKSFDFLLEEPYSFLFSSIYKKVIEDDCIYNGRSIIMEMLLEKLRENYGKFVSKKENYLNSYFIGTNTDINNKKEKSRIRRKIFIYR